MPSVGYATLSGIGDALLCILFCCRVSRGVALSVSNSGGPAGAAPRSELVSEGSAEGWDSSPQYWWLVQGVGLWQLLTLQTCPLW